ncbi:hypothetical protein PAXINDRAFT_92787, partial [Paxillus involutus ATCC 200175]
MADTVKIPSRNCDEEVPLLPGSLDVPKRPTPLPKVQIVILLLACLIKPIASQSILPYINQLVSELDIVGGDNRKVGYYAGLIESLFFVTEALTVLQWSRVSDRVGRKPVLLLGTFGLCLSMLCFGLSRTFWALVLSRCITGALSGNTGITKSIMGELTDATNRAQGFAFLPMIWSFGVMFGPALGGSLARPQEHFPRLFAAGFWRDYPYFLPSLVVAMFAALTFMMILLFLNESRPTMVDGEETSHGGDYGTINETHGASGHNELDGPVPLRSLLVPKVLVPVACHASVSVLQFAMVALQALFYSTPIEDGGLGFTPATSGFWMSCQGVSNGIIQAFFFAPLISKLGAKTLFRIGHGAY